MGRRSTEVGRRSRSAWPRPGLLDPVPMGVFNGRGRCGACFLAWTRTNKRRWTAGRPEPCRGRAWFVSDWCRGSLPDRIATPQPLKGSGKSLIDDRRIGRASIAGQIEMHVVPHRPQRLAHALVGNYPVVIAGLGRRIVVVDVADLEPHPVRILNVLRFRAFAVLTCT